MKPRFPILLLSSVVLALAPVRAQESQPQQDPDVTGPEPASVRLTELLKEKDRLIREIGYVRELLAKGGLASRVAAKLEERSLDPKAVDAGQSKAQSPPVKAAVEPRKAMLMTEEQKAKYMPDVVFIVEGRPVRESAVEELVEHLKASGLDADDNTIKSRAIMELVKTEFAHSAFIASATGAASQIREIEASIGRGVEFEELARNRSRHPSSSQGGDLGFMTRSSGQPLKLEQMAFATEVGKVTPVFRTPLGYNLLRVTEERESDAGRSIRASLILVPYHDALDEVMQVQSNVSLGQVNIRFRDDAMRQLLPPLYR